MMAASRTEKRRKLVELGEQEIVVRIVQQVQDVIVVNYENQDKKIFQGVLLDSTKRHLPFGVNPPGGFSKKLADDNPREFRSTASGSGSDHLSTVDASESFPTLSRRHTYFLDSKVEKPPLLYPSTSGRGSSLLHDKQRLGVRLRARQVLCSKCSSVCNEKGENVRENSKKERENRIKAVDTAAEQKKFSRQSSKENKTQPATPVTKSLRLTQRNVSKASAPASPAPPTSSAPATPKLIVKVKQVEGTAAVTVVDCSTPSPPGVRLLATLADVGGCSSLHDEIIPSGSSGESGVRGRGGVGLSFRRKPKVLTRPEGKYRPSQLKEAKSKLLSRNCSLVPKLKRLHPSQFIKAKDIGSCEQASPRVKSNRHNSVSNRGTPFRLTDSTRAEIPEASMGVSSPVLSSCLVSSSSPSSPTLVSPAAEKQAHPRSSLAASASVSERTNNHRLKLRLLPNMSKQTRNNSAGIHYSIVSDEGEKGALREDNCGNKVGKMHEDPKFEENGSNISMAGTNGNTSTSSNSSCDRSTPTLKRRKQSISSHLEVEESVREEGSAEKRQGNKLGHLTPSSVSQAGAEKTGTVLKILLTGKPTSVLTMPAPLLLPPVLNMPAPHPPPNPSENWCSVARETRDHQDVGPRKLKLNLKSLKKDIGSSPGSKAARKALKRAKKDAQRKVGLLSPARGTGYLHSRSPSYRVFGLAQSPAHRHSFSSPSSLSPGWLTPSSTAVTTLTTANAATSAMAVPTLSRSYQPRMQESPVGEFNTSATSPAYTCLFPTNQKIIIRRNRKKKRKKSKEREEEVVEEREYSKRENHGGNTSQEKRNLPESTKMFINLKAGAVIPLHSTSKIYREITEGGAEGVGISPEFSVSTPQIITTSEEVSTWEQSPCKSEVQSPKSASKASSKVLEITTFPEFSTPKPASRISETDASPCVVFTSSPRPGLTPSPRVSHINSSPGVVVTPAMAALMNTTPRSPESDKGSDIPASLDTQRVSTPCTNNSGVSVPSAILLGGNTVTQGDVIWGHVGGPTNPWWPGKIMDLMVVKKGGGCDSVRGLESTGPVVGDGETAPAGVGKAPVGVAREEETVVSGVACEVDEPAAVKPTVMAQVTWYASNKTSVVPCSLLKPFLQSYQTVCRSDGLGLYKQAVDLANQQISNLSLLGNLSPPREHPTALPPAQDEVDSPSPNFQSPVQ